MILTETLALLVEKRDWFFELLLQHIGISLISIALAALIGGWFESVVLVLADKAWANRLREKSNPSITNMILDAARGK